jgi:HlyD family secretion protein
MTKPLSPVVKRVLGAVVVLGVIVFIVYGLYLAARPVFAPLQGQIDGRYIDISAKIVGRIAKLHAREGDEVKVGELLVTLDSPEVEAKVAQAEAAHGAAAAKQELVDVGTRQEEVRTARANWELSVATANLAQTTFKRINSLYRDGLVSQQRNDEVDTASRAARNAANAARAQYDLTLNGFRKEDRVAAAEVTRGTSAAVQEVGALAADTSLRSPIAAEVDKVLLHQGELATPGFPLMSLVNLDDVWAVFNLRENELASVKIGTIFAGRVPALGDRTVKFSVYYISPKGEYATWRATRQSSGYDIKTFEVRARATEKIDGLRPGMSVLVDRR